MLRLFTTSGPGKRFIFFQPRGPGCECTLTELPLALLVPPSVAQKQSAGVLLYRVRLGAVEVLLVHPGGPYWARRDAGSWSLPKGEFSQDEDGRSAALREFEEETGTRLPTDELVELGTVVQKGGKEVTAWAARGDLDAGAVRSNTFELEWPPRSGRVQEFPEVDRAAWFGLEEAAERLLPGQVPLLERLRDSLARENG
jgi:predicted NUDIX family NTP pyrophosphohydrolase